MDAFCPRQCEDLDAIDNKLAQYIYSWRHRSFKCFPQVTLWQPSRQLASELAFATLPIINCLSFAGITSFMAKDIGVQEAVLRYARTPVGNASAALKRPCLGCYIRQSVDLTNARQQQERFLANYALSRGSALWTWITHAFVHLSQGHLVGNMISLWMFSFSCVRVPTMRPTHVVAVVLGSSTFTSAVQLISWYLFNESLSRNSVGSSAVVLAFGGIAAAAEVEPTTKRSFWRIASVSVNMALQVIADVVAITVRSLGMTPRRIPGQAQPAHLGHLTGVVFGGGYYYMFLRSHKSAVKDLEDGQQLDDSAVADWDSFMLSIQQSSLEM